MFANHSKQLNESLKMPFSKSTLTDGPDAFNATTYSKTQSMSDWLQHTASTSKNLPAHQQQAMNAELDAHIARQFMFGNKKESRFKFAHSVVHHSVDPLGANKMMLDDEE